MPEAAFGELPESPGKHAIVPGNPDASELMRRVTSEDPDVRMPPLQSHKVLGDAQIAILRKWIDDGAEYKPHWAFIAPASPRVPRADFDDRAINEIDRFVYARLENEGLSPAPRADRETLINRVSLSLTGLPPTLEDVDAFVADAAPDAYEKLVDRLLASPAYAEHMATYWMDLARFSESDGFLDDHHDRFLWPWRDWLIQALDRNMPFDEFSTWQLAGDLMPGRTRDQLLATAFLRVGKRTTENGAIDEEYRVEYVIDRTDTVGNAFLGLTTGCARCHDHKYDPISHKDYYSLTGFFNSTDEPGFYAPGHSAVQGGPTLPWPSTEQKARLDAAERDIAIQEQAYRTALDSASDTVRSEIGTPSRELIARELDASLSKALVAHYPFESTTAIPDRDLPGLLIERKDPPPELVSLRRRPAPAGNQPAQAVSRAAQAPRVPQGYVREQMVYSPSTTRGTSPAVLQSPILRDGINGKAMYFDEENKGFLGKTIGYHDRTEGFSLDFWFNPAEKYPEKVPVINHRDDDNSGGSGYRLELEDGRLRFYMAHSRPYNMLAIAARDELPLNRWSHIALTYDGSSKVSGLKLYMDGKEAAVDVVRDNLTQSILPTSYAPLFDSFVGLAFGSRFREKSPVGSGLDEVRVFDRDLKPLEVAYLHDRDVVEASPAVVAAQLAEVRVANQESVQAALRALTEAREVQNEMVRLVPQVLVMGDTPAPRPTYRLDRGVYSEKKEELPVKALEEVLPWDPALPPNRIGLAKWLFDPKNPLTSRVFVNRMWQMHFGRGLVETSEDFGAQGSIPSHPELLDWLAVHFIESGWDMKGLHKLLVMSATFQQDSDATDEALARDPLNLLLARGVRQRMPAEMVRDNALLAAGLLVGKVGGPSVRPYQPQGVWNPLNSFHEYPTPDSIPDDEQHRRSLYTFIKRSAPPPGMQNFDLADRNVSTARRRISNTPLQALELMNDPQFVEAYRQLAAHASKAGKGDEEQLRRIFRLARRQDPAPEQLQIMKEYFEQQLARFEEAPADASKLLEIGVTPVDVSIDAVRLAALTNVTAVVMNSPDAYTIR